MSSFDVVIDVDVPVTRLWAALVDWPILGEVMPFTTVRVTSAQRHGVGASFVGRTSVGRFGFDDPMTVVDWRPPTPESSGRCVVRKTGNVVLGEAAFVVEPRGDGRSRLRWHEDVEIAPVALTRPLSPLVRAAGRVTFALALRRLARRVSRHRGPR